MQLRNPRNWQKGWVSNCLTLVVVDCHGIKNSGAVHKACFWPNIYKNQWPQTGSYGNYVEFNCQMLSAFIHHLKFHRASKLICMWTINSSINNNISLSTPHTFCFSFFLVPSNEGIAKEIPVFPDFDFGLSYIVQPILYKKLASFISKK